MQRAAMRKRSAGFARRFARRWRLFYLRYPQPPERERPEPEPWTQRNLRQAEPLRGSAP